MSVIPYKAKEITAATKEMIDPTLFEGRSTSNAVSPHAMDGVNWVDVTFVDVTFEASGDFDYVGGILTNVGVNSYKMEQGLSCSVACDVINTNVRLAQWKNGAEDSGAQNKSKAESNVASVPFSIDTPFMMAPGDTLNLRLFADKVCNVDISNFSVVLEATKVILP